ncbi:MAG: membrane protein insertion efficiency factor YidD [Candidatus Shapirobacteria bacterium]|nr:membrane protein insertion efficiency factor YidD [Candidatus Shapirobacteria bacterium]
MKTVVLKMLVFYKKYISGMEIGNHCRFTPTCSEYTYLAVKKYGVVKGLFLGVKRILKCNPLSKGGVDLIE